MRFLAPDARHPPCSPADTCAHLWSLAAGGVLRGAPRRARRLPCRACCRPPWRQGRRLDPGSAQNLQKPPAQGKQAARGGRACGGRDDWERETTAPRREFDAWNGSRQGMRSG
jgi:hypothetical protein